jgi:hypothetical protein
MQKPATCRSFLLMELLVALLNLETGPKLDRLAQAIKHLEGDPASHGIVFPELPPAQGQILMTIKHVLAAYPDGLQAFEVRRAAELQLGRKLAKSTVNAALAENPAFKRIGYGRYRLVSN